MVKILDKNGQPFDKEKSENNDDEQPQVYPDGFFKDLISQVNAEYTYAYKALSGKIDAWLKRLKLYNNQKRDPAAVGDPLLFTVHQTVLASLYDDRLMAQWTEGIEGDEDLAVNLNHMAEKDYYEMEKDVFDYEWDWDSSFFGRGLAMFSYFDRDVMTPIPEVIDPTTFLRDPDAKSVNGDRLGNGAARFFGREIEKTKYDMEMNPSYFGIDKINNSSDAATALQSLTQKAKDARKDAQNIDNFKHQGTSDLKDNQTYTILQWFTTWKDPAKNKYVRCMVELTNERTNVIRYKILKRKTRRKGKMLWPVIDRAIYPMAHDWDGVSIPDLIEDKQRARSVIINLGLRHLRYSMYPSYIYDKNIITNRADLQNVEFNRHIPANGNPNNAMAPVRKDAPSQQMANFILNLLDTAAQKSTATPDIQQGMASQVARPLGETNIVASKVDTRYSLSAKIFGWSEKRFWLEWYASYKENFDEKIDEKVLRIEGAFGAKWRKLNKDNFVSDLSDPDVKIESMLMAEQKRLKKLQKYERFIGIVLQDPTANRRYALKRLARLNDWKKDEIDRLLPPTSEELQAEKENEELNKNKRMRVKPTDNHITHLEIHNKAADTPATYAHVQTHIEAMRLQRENPEQYPQAQAEAAQNATANQSVAAQIASGNIPEESQPPQPPTGGQGGSAGGLTPPSIGA